MKAKARISEDGVKEFRRRLQDVRRQLLKVVATTDEELATLEAHQAGNLTEDTATELATAVLSRLEGRQRHVLDEIDAAQARLEAGVFGVCERCGAAIALARLRAMPATRFCRSCQAREERTPGATP